MIGMNVTRHGVDSLMTTTTTLELCTFNTRAEGRIHPRGAQIREFWASGALLSGFTLSYDNGSSLSFTLNCLLWSNYHLTTRRSSERRTPARSFCSNACNMLGELNYYSQFGPAAIIGLVSVLGLCVLGRNLEPRIYPQEPRYARSAIPLSPFIIPATQKTTPPS